MKGKTRNARRRRGRGSPRPFSWFTPPRDPDTAQTPHAVVFPDDGVCLALESQPFGLRRPLRLGSDLIPAHEKSDEGARILLVGVFGAVHARRGQEPHLV